jgi:hypothetical protein
MLPTAHPEVLALDWVPPVLNGREAETAEVVRRLDAPRPVAPPPWMVAVVGAPGSGTSAVARRAAREVADRLRADRPGPPPRVLAVRVAGRRGTHGVATALLQLLDDGFDGRGFPVAEILAGTLRRLRREGRPTVLVLDDIRVGGPDLAPLLRAIGEPDRFLPEGEVGLPPTWVVLGGTPDAVGSVDRSLRSAFSIRPFVPLPPYEARELAAIVRGRLERAVGPGVPIEAVGAAVERALEDGGGATRALEILRRRLLGHALRSEGFFPTSARCQVPVETHVVRAIGAASRGTSARLADVKRWEAALAREHGVRPLPATTLWRRIVRLEQAGYVRREIRPGGVGGTLSVVRLLAPIDEWVTVPTPTDNPRAAAPWPAPPGSEVVAPPVAPPPLAPYAPGAAAG